MANGLCWVILGALLLVPLTHGNALGYVAMLGAVGGFFVADRPTYRAVLAMPQTRILIVAFVLLAIAIVAVSGPFSHDTLVAFDFTPFLLVIPANAVFLHARIGRPALAIAVLSAGGAIVALLVAGFQFVVLDNTRPGGWELSPIHFADLGVTLGFLGLGGLLVETPPRWAALLWLAPLAGLVAAILSGTRTALLVAVVEAVLAVIYFVRRYRLPLRTTLGAIIALVAAAIIVSLLAPVLHLGRAFDVIGVFEQLFSDQRVTDYTAGVRLDQYQAALKAIANAPIFGHGWRDQVQSALQYMSPASQRAYAIEHWGYIHDEFLSFSVGMGFFGALSWVLMTAYPIVALVRAPQSSEPAARNYMTLAAWAGILIGGLSDVLFNTELTKTFYCFIPGAIVILCSTRPLSLQHPAVLMDSVHASIGETP